MWYGFNLLTNSGLTVGGYRRGGGVLLGNVVTGGGRRCVRGLPSGEGNGAHSSRAKNAAIVASVENLNSDRLSISPQIIDTK